MEFRELLKQPLMDRFHIVIPCLPGYGWSEAPKVSGFDVVATAQVFAALMARLGYDKYFIQGGDWGGIIGASMAQMDAEHVLGFHTNFFPDMLYPAWVPLFGPLLLSQPDLQRLNFPLSNFAKVALELTGYMHIQASRPDTLAVGLHDSPVALAAWVLEKFQEWSDCNGDLLALFSMDDLLNNVMVYWVTDSIGSSLRFYRESLWSARVWASMFAQVHVPVGLADFPKELMRVPELLVHLKFTHVLQYTAMPVGGHFAAMEQPLLLAQDLCAFVDKVNALGPKAK